MPVCSVGACPHKDAHKGVHYTGGSIVLLVVDIGNSQTACGIFDAAKLVSEWRYPTRHIQVDPCKAELSRKLLSTGVKPEQITGCIISSVVPDINDVFREVCKRLFKMEPLFVSIAMNTGISVKYEDPGELGADRIANAAACHKLYPGNAIIVDFGTATTFCVINKKGEYEGGIIAPGIGISMQALAEKAALLPEIELCVPDKIIGKNTVESMQIGFVYGFRELVDGIARRLKTGSFSDARVLATGGWAKLIAPLSCTITVTDTMLTLKGLQIIYQMNSGVR